MSSSKHITLVYHLENQLLAQAFEKTFAKAEVQFHHLVCKEGEFSPDFNTTLSSESHPIVLLISYNYLQSEAAMLNALPTLQQHVRNQQITPIIVEGIDENGKIVDTKFDRIGQIITYMNFWQDRYLHLRSEGRSRGEIDDALELRIKNVRSISTNIGEYLRYLRDLNAPHIQDLVADNFEGFKTQFDINGVITPGFFARFSDGKSIESKPATTALAVEEIVEEKRSELPETPIVEEEEIIDIPIPEDIPVEEPVINHGITNIAPESIAETSVPEIEEVVEKKEAEIKMIPKRKFSLPYYLDDLGKDPSEEVVPVNLDEKLLLVKSHIRNQEFYKAKNELDQLGEKFPRDARVWKNLGNIAEQQADYIQACTHYSRALELDPTLPELDYKVGLITSNFYPDQVDRAIQFFKSAVDKNPAQTDAHYQLGILINEQKNNPLAAIPIFENVLSLAPDHEFANYDLALIHYDQGDKVKGLEFYQKAFRNNPELQTPENDLAFGYKEGSTIVEEVVIPAEDTPPPRPVIDKTVLITGATSGIGKATAAAFSDAGYRVVLCGRRETRLIELAEELKQDNPAIRHLTFDVREITGVQEALNTLESPFSEIDLLINNAGLASGFDPIQEGDLRDWDKMIDTNIKGVLNMVRLISPQMVERQSGQIINVCSTAGHEVYPKGNVYCATKHAVDALTKGMRMDLHAHGIKVGQVSPAHVEETEFAKVRFHGDEEKAKIYNDFNPLKSSDVADVILYIASQPAHVNIQDILLMGTQQASSMVVDRSGRKYD